MVRWPCLLQVLLGDDYKVIEEGLNGRTTVFDDPNDDWKNGLDYIKGILCTHRPVDYLVIMLGTNDMKTVYDASLDAIAAGLNEIVSRAEKVMDLKQGYVPKILIVSPPEISEDILTGPFGGSFDTRSIDKSKRLAEYYKKVADKHGCMFLDAKQYIKPSVEDGLHLGPDGHKGLAEIIAKTLLGS